MTEVMLSKMWGSWCVKEAAIIKMVPHDWDNSVLKDFQHSTDEGLESRSKVLGELTFCTENKVLYPQCTIVTISQMYAL